MDEKLAELREAYAKGRAPYERGLSAHTYHSVVIPADALIAALEQRVGELEAALRYVESYLTYELADWKQRGEEETRHTRMMDSVRQHTADALAAKRNGV